MDQTGPRTNVPWRLCARIVAQLLLVLPASVVCVCVCVWVCVCVCVCASARGMLCRKLAQTLSSNK